MSANNILKIGFWLLVISYFLTSCAADRGPDYRPPLSGAIGKTSEIIVVADKAMWEGAVGDTFRYYFGSAYLILPQPEPLFDLRHFTINDLKDDPNRRQLRTYVVLGNLSSETSQSAKMLMSDIGDEKVSRAKTNKNFHTVIGHNKWAMGQMFTYIFGNTDDELMNNIRESFPTVSKRVQEFDEVQVDSWAYFKGRNIPLENEIKKELGVNIKIPEEYIAAISDETTYWLRKETSDISNNIFVHKLPYTSKDQFTQEGMRSIRDSLGRKYVTTEVDKTYMKTNDVDLPMFMQTMEVNGQYAVEARGIWDIKGDFMGGPFIGYLIHNQENNELVYVEGFVHAPTTSKRKYMQALEHVLKTTSFENSSDEVVKE